MTMDDFQKIERHVDYPALMRYAPAIRVQGWLIFMIGFCYVYRRVSTYVVCRGRLNAGSVCSCNDTNDCRRACIHGLYPCTLASVQADTYPETSCHSTGQKDGSEQW